MYEKHFNFSENPFTIAPNPRYLYLTDRHREALAHLTYGLRENGGFILLTGEVGTGKTTVCRCLLEHVPEDVHLALVLTPTLGGNELLEAICDEFGIKHRKDATSKALTDALNRYLLDVHSQGQRAAVIIDEAQNLAVEVLEQLRLLTNLETNEQKLLQIILIGQPEFLTKLRQPELRQLSQRIVARFHLTPLKNDEVRAYISHRLKIAGGSASIFPAMVALRVAQLSKGVPRLINLLCDRALLGCYAQDKHQVDMKTLEQAAREVFGEPKVLRKQVLRERGVRSYLGYWWAMPAAAAAVAVIYLLASPVEFGQLWRGEQQAVSELPSVEHAAVAVADEVMSETTPATPASEATLAHNSELPAAPLTWETLEQEEHGETGAYLALFKRWEVQYSPDAAQTPCGFAFENQLDCWHQRGRFSDLQRLNRPVLLKFVSGEGKLFYAALLSVNGQRLRLGLGEREMEVSRREVERWWTDEFTLLWRRPLGFAHALQPGEESDFAAWIGEKMSRIEGRKVASLRSQVYDFALVSRVRSLQRRCGLRVDGLVGRETIILINSMASGAPVLSRNVSRQCMRRLNV